MAGYWAETMAACWVADSVARSVEMKAAMWVVCSVDDSAERMAGW